MVGLHRVMWIVMFKSDEDTSEQQVPPHVQYGMASLLIRGVVGSVPSLDEWELA
jgi:hypothetical protein